jgi:nucleotide-binding universal stress UspA family protein
MYRRILVALEHSPKTDECILDHVRKLAKCCGSAIVLIHVADGWVARNIRQLDLRDSEEMQQDREYIEHRCAELTSEGFDADAVLASGDPSAEIAAAAEREECDLIAMATHGHKFLADMVKGSVANEVRHRSMVPVLLVRAPHGAKVKAP